MPRFAKYLLNAGVINSSFNGSKVSGNFIGGSRNNSFSDESATPYISSKYSSVSSYVSWRRNASSLTKLPDAHSASYAPRSAQVPAYSPVRFTKNDGWPSYRNGLAASNLSEVQRGRFHSNSRNSVSMSMSSVCPRILISDMLLYLRDHIGSYFVNNFFDYFVYPLVLCIWDS